MKIKLGVVMDPIATIHVKKDSTFAMLLEAQKREWEIHYFEQQDLFVKDGKAWGQSRLLKVYEDPDKWFEFSKQQRIPLTDLSIILMRKDPPLDLEYIYTTYILELAEHAGVLVVNKPQSLRDANEKLFTAWFPEYCPPTLVTRNLLLLRDFLEEQQDIICKPLEGMGGYSIFRLCKGDVNTAVIFEMLTQRGARFIMAQRFIPDISQGDKRILMIAGEPVPYALARIPAPGEIRGNLAAGGRGVAQPLSPRDQAICQAIGPTLLKKGLFFVGLDVIGDYLTEINVTSPTCIRELDQQYNLTISAQLLDKLTALIRTF